MGVIRVPPARSAPALIFPLLAGLAGSAGAMPLHPDAEAKLAREGALAAYESEMAALHRQGFDRPASPPRVVAALAAGDTGGMQVAVILVDFSDLAYPDAVQNGSDYDADHFRTLLFSDSSYATGSMRDYYRENSYGRFNLTGQVSGWHRMPQTYAHYVAGERGIGGAYPRNARALVEDAVRLADDSDPGLDWRVFDNDGPDGIPSSGDDDGIVDGVIVVHAGPGYEETSNRDDIHSHFWNVVDLDLEVDGVRVFPYVICPQNGKIGVFSHEFGHNLGLPDLYEAGGSSVVGVWSIMSYGAWLGSTGTPFGPGAGTRPAHFDAWSKVFLGFVAPANLTDNGTGHELRPVEDEPDIVRLWTNGAGSPQYFLVENRAPRGFDGRLPFASSEVGGLLIWHVDEEAATNDDPDHPRVALEQADGLREIERGFDYGDSADPFSGGAFNFLSRPSSADYTGADTQVRVEGISRQGATYLANLTVETRPAVRKVRLSLVGEEGNGDGGLDATERAVAEVEIENIGLGASGLSVDLESADPRIEVGGGPIVVGDLPANGTIVVPGRFPIAVGALPADPYPVTLDLRYSGDGYEAAERVLLVAGDVIGFRSDVEQGEDGFAHSPGRPAYVDDWHVAEGAGRAGSVGWRCALPGEASYRDLTDARLDTPVFAMNGETRLIFWHRIDAEVDEGPRAWDGGVVELSVDGAPFQPIEPIEPGGYPFEIIRNNASPIAERGAFSGAITEFERVVFDLAGLAGAGRVRFHFGSDGTEVRGGWVVDDITVASPAEPYGVTFLTPPVTGAGEVVVSFEVDEFFPELPYAGRGFNVYRKPSSPSFPLPRLAGNPVPQGYVRLNGAPLAAGETFVDRTVLPAEFYAYLLEDLREAGQEPRLYGPRRVFVPGPDPAPRLVRSNPNPFQPADGRAVVQFLVPAGPGPGGTAEVHVRLSVYDTAGHLVAKLVDGPRFPGKNEARWDGGTVRGFAAPSGIYFLRLEAEGETHGMRMVLLR